MNKSGNSKSATTNLTDDELFRRLIELSPVPMAVHAEGRYVLANTAAAKLFGAKSPKELVGLRVLEYVHSDSRQAVKERITLLLNGKRKHITPLEEKLIRLDGSVIDAEIVSLLVNYQNKPSIQLILHDITKQKLVGKKILRARDEAIDEQRRLYSLLVEVPAMVAVVKGPNYTLELVNTEFLKVTGKTRKIVGRPVLEVFPEVRTQAVVESLETVYRTGRPHSGTEVCVKLDIKGNGTLEGRYFNFVYQPVPSRIKKVDSVMLYANDVTKQVLARHEVEEREQQYRSIFNASHDAILIFKMDGQLVEANPAALTMYGYTYKEMLRLAARDLVPVEDAHITDAIVNTVKSGKAFKGVRQHRTKKGMPIVADVTVTGIIYNQEPHFMSVVRDITKRKQSEEALRYSNALLQTVMNNASLGLFMLDDQYQCTFMNRAAERITGYRFEEIRKLARSLHDILHNVHPDGSEYPIEDCPINKAFSKRQRRYGEDYFVRPDGTFYPVRFTASPIINDGVAVGTIIEVEDITEVLKTKEAYAHESNRRTELEDVAAALAIQKARLLDLNKSKDEFISLASHQLRTPATAVKQYTAMALEGYAGELSPMLREFLEKAYQSNERQLGVISDLLKVAQLDAGKVELQKKKFDIVALVRSILDDDASMFAKHKQEVVFSHDDDLVVYADKDRIRMAIENIVDNASKYSRKNKKLTVEVRKRADIVRISIEDEGVGMETGDMKKIFNKFVRIDNALSVEVGGSGLGLYWAKKIIDLHGGSIQVASDPGKGSTFTIELPIA